jgi:hypothetical protein
MPYNYLSAFADAPDLDPCIRKELAIAGILTFRNEFPNIDLLKVEVLVATKHVEVEGGGEYRLYPFHMLGFEL